MCCVILHTHLIYAPSYPGSISKELEAFRSSYSELELVNPCDVVGQLYTKNVISRADRDQINERSSMSEKVGLLLRAVERAINTDKSKFSIFVEILQTQYMVFLKGYNKCSQKKASIYMLNNKHGCMLYSCMCCILVHVVLHNMCCQSKKMVINVV